MSYFRIHTREHELNGRSYEGLVQFVERYLRACEDNPSCTVWVSR